MKIKFQLMIGYGLIIIIMIFLMIMTYRNLNSLVDKENWVRHTLEVISSANHLQKLLIDMETGQRGFVITGKENFLEPYHTGSRRYSEEYIRLTKLVSDNPQQIRILADIDAQMNKWQRTAAVPEINARKQYNEGKESWETVGNMIASETGKSLMDSLRIQIHQFINNEEVLLNQRRGESVSEVIKTKSIIMSGTLIAICIGIVSVVLVLQKLKRRLEDYPAELEEMVSFIVDRKLQKARQEKNGSFASNLSSIKMVVVDQEKQLAKKEQIIARLESDLAKAKRNEK